MEFLIIIGFGLVSSYIAIRKNRSPLFWLLVGGITTIIGLGILLFLKKAKPQTVVNNNWVTRIDALITKFFKRIFG